MGRVLPQSGEGPLEVRFYVSSTRKSGVKYIVNELKYVAKMGASVKVSRNTQIFNVQFIQANRNKYIELIKSYPLMVRFMSVGNLIHDCQYTRSQYTIKVA